MDGSMDTHRGERFVMHMEKNSPVPPPPLAKQNSHNNQLNVGFHVFAAALLLFSSFCAVCGQVWGVEPFCMLPDGI